MFGVKRHFFNAEHGDGYCADGSPPFLWGVRWEAIFGLLEAHVIFGEGEVVGGTNPRKAGHSQIHEHAIGRSPIQDRQRLLVPLCRNQYVGMACENGAH